MQLPLSTAPWFVPFLALLLFQQLRNALEANKLESVANLLLFELLCPRQFHALMLTRLFVPPDRIAARVTCGILHSQIRVVFALSLLKAHPRVAKSSSYVHVTICSREPLQCGK